MKTEIKIFAILFLFSLNNPACITDQGETGAATDYSDTIAYIDTHYVDPKTGHLKPPCSMSPDWCACMKSRKAPVNCSEKD